MYNNKTYWAFIPARGGSRRLPGKNINNLGGKPLINWSIEAGQESKYIDRVILSTDLQEIAETAKNAGAHVPFIRPGTLASDTASTTSVIEHAIKFFQEKEGVTCDYIVLLQPTSPLRDHEDIDNAITFLNEKAGDAVVSVCQTEHSPLWANLLPDNLVMDRFIRDEVKGKRSQDLPAHYRLNGAIYIIDTEIFLKEKAFLLQQNCYAFIMENLKSVDIDSEIDFILAESIIKYLNK